MHPPDPRFRSPAARPLRRATRAPRRIVVRPLPLPRHSGLLQLEGHLHRCALGRSGVTHRKREGDGATPVGCLTLEWGALRPDRRPPMPIPTLPTLRLAPDDGWCDASHATQYNRAVRLPVPFSAERMWREDHLYDAVIGLSWNTQPVRRGLGSAIFLHLARPGLRPTDGCVAVPRPLMRRLLRLVRAGDQVLVLSPGESGPPKRTRSGRRRF
ncbi:L,D-transpeptidase [Afifella sp. IM 167]|uniref:L,D-transpeptidase family protein n=1 Tax=Afifella sp. IM 167 TaxID=2033586 RepID=UPI001CC93850|nr:L,D-transpeptidase family protein [Afifella sp. IM 167]MBZ8135059.1 L,D-transpeptidase catalytic domain protein [Afifella sp. IM 167]